MEKEKILEVKDLKVSFQTFQGSVQAVRGVSWHLNKKETIAIVGESKATSYCLLLSCVSCTLYPYAFP